MSAGTVKWFSRDKAHGFVEPEDGAPDVFAHIAEAFSSETVSLHCRKDVRREPDRARIGLEMLPAGGGRRHVTRAPGSTEGAAMSRGGPGRASTDAGVGAPALRKLRERRQA